MNAQTAEQREKRLAIGRQYMALKKLNETPEQREIRLAKNREGKARKIQNETPEEKETRLAKNREKDAAKSRQYRARKKQNETSEERESRLARKRESRARLLVNETPEQKEKRLARYREYKARQMQNKTLEQKEGLARRLQQETPEQRAQRKARQIDITTENENTFKHAAEKLNTEITTQKEEQLTKENPYKARKIISITPEQGQKCLPKNHQPIFCKPQSEEDSAIFNEKSEQMENKLFITQANTSSLSSRQDIKQKPSNLPIILINDEKRTIIVGVKHEAV